MEDKNRFSILLEHLLEVAEVKNYTLAKRLQYDVSYISKWVSGRMLPAKKTEKRVMEGISACVVDEATDDGRDLLLREYSVSIPSDLKAAIYDNLIAEYDYLQEELDSGEARIGPYTDFWAELNMLQYLTKMAHPVLRRVSQLDIVAVMDLMEMAREYRLKVANLQNGQLVDQRSYDNVYFKLMIDISREKWDPIYDAAAHYQRADQLQPYSFQAVWQHRGCRARGVCGQGRFCHYRPVGQPQPLRCRYRHRGSAELRKPV